MRSDGSIVGHRVRAVVVVVSRRSRLVISRTSAGGEGEKGDGNRRRTAAPSARRHVPPGVLVVLERLLRIPVAPPLRHRRDMLTVTTLVNTLHYRPLRPPKPILRTWRMTPRSTQRYVGLPGRPSTLTQVWSMTRFSLSDPPTANLPVMGHRKLRGSAPWTWLPTRRGRAREPWGDGSLAGSYILGTPDTRCRAGGWQTVNGTTLATAH